MKRPAFRASLIVAAFALVLSACHRHRPAVAPAPAAFTSVSFERRPCFGTCPVYLVTVAGNGDVLFEGRQHVDSVGRFAAHLAPAQITELQTLFAAQQFQALDERYGMGAPGCSAYATDASVIVMTFASAGGTKRVEHDGGCIGAPERLRVIERRIDEIVGSARWIGAGGGRPQHPSL